MSWLGDTLRRLRSWRHARFDDDLAEEMRLHLDLRAADRLAEGMPAREARAAARKQFGNPAVLRETSREAWGWTFADQVRQDIRYAVRSFLASPGFAASAVLSLALGIGANTAIFSIINAVMLRSLPVENPNQLVQIRMGEGGEELTNPIWEQIRDHQQAFSGTLAYCPTRFDLSDGGERSYANGIWVSGGFFQTLGVPALQGRTLQAMDDRHGGGASGPVAVISYAFWKRNFGGAPNVVGKTVRLNRHTFEIVGVTPPWFTGLNTDQSFDIAVPIGEAPVLNPEGDMLNGRATWWLYLLGRIPPGESLARAQDRIRSLAPEILRATLPDEFDGDSRQEYLKGTFSLHPAATGFSNTGGRYRTALLTLMATVGLVLLIGCANLANLLLARAASRQRELSVRMAMGASRWRLVRQLMTESVLLSLAGAAGGLLFAVWCGPLLVRLLSTQGHPIEIDLSPNGAVLGFTLAMGAATAIVFGLAPALSATRQGLNQVLKENARGAVSHSGRFHLREALVAGQVGLSLVLLVAASLFLGTLRKLLTTDPGFSKQNVLLVSAALGQASSPPSLRPQLTADILDRLRALPGVVSASASFRAPITDMGWAQGVAPEGMAPKSPRETVTFLNAVSPGYFETIRNPLLAGRDFNSRDTANGRKVMIIGELAARQFFASANPLGKTIGLPGRQNQMELYQVVGIVKDAKYSRINEAARRTAYLPLAQMEDPPPTLSFEIRFGGVAEAVVPLVRSAFSQADPAISLEFRTLEAQVAESLVQPRVVALLSAAFGALALILAVIGLYGVTNFAATRRKSEIGIRMALGATRRSVVWLMLREMFVLLGVGTAAGLAATLGAGRMIRSLLYGLKPDDPQHIAIAVAVLMLAGAAAAYLPARRAARLDPMEALREE